jgi:hypothetical protein
MSKRSAAVVTRAIAIAASLVVSLWASAPRCPSATAANEALMMLDEALVLVVCAGPRADGGA